MISFHTLLPFSFIFRYDVQMKRNFPTKMHFEKEDKSFAETMENWR